MPAMESTGGAFSPRSSRSQTPMMPQSKFNMPSAGGGGLKNFTPMSGGLTAGLGKGNSVAPGGAAGGMLPGVGGGNALRSAARPPRTAQPGMGMR